jgi:ribonucleoside-diphosphate reductase alpha chain
MKERYLQDGETVDERIDAIAKAAASVETSDTKYWEDRFKEAIHNRWFLPSSPILMSLGRKKPYACACNVLPINDCMEGIMKALTEQAMVLKYGGGTGFSFGRLRSGGVSVQGTGGSASGPCSFIKMFDMVSKSVEQGGRRRGANIGILPVHHPDINKFIELKRDGSLTEFNLSVGITDEFMEAVKEGTNFQLVDPKLGPVSEVPAREIFNHIVECAYETGDPGLFFLDTVNRDSPLDVEVEAPNPCLVGETRFPGPMGISQEIGKRDSISVWDGESWVKAKVIPRGLKEIVKLILSNGMEMRCTPDHHFFSGGKKVEASEMEGMEIDLLPVEVEQSNSSELPILKLAGFLQGDGGYHKASGRWKYMYIGEHDQEVLDLAQNLGWGLKQSKSKYWAWKLPTTVADRVSVFLDDCRPATERRLPSSFWRMKSSEKADFLGGLYSANGSVCGDRFTLKSTSKMLIQDVQEALSYFGIRSYITVNKEHVVEFENGTYTCGESYDLNVASSEDRIRFLNWVRPIQSEKLNRMKDASARHKKGTRHPITVVSVVPDGEEEVFDFQMTRTHFASYKGIKVSNCGEFPTVPYGSCILGSIALPNVEENNFEHIVRTGTRFLDNCIEVTDFPVPEIEEVAKTYRFIGLGIMGLAQELTKQGIAYDSEAGRDYTEQLMQRFHQLTRTASEELGEEKGEVFDGRRNVTHNAIAPTGTISILADVTSGIEPPFALEYTREIVGIGKVEILSPAAREAGLTSDEGCPSYLKTAGEIAPIDHVKMLDAVQRHIDSGVSKTVNLPNSASKADIESVYFEAHNRGCKGVTIFRDGCKPGVLSTRTTQRPAVIQGQTTRYKTGCGKLYVHVNRDPTTGLPFEAFANLGKMGGCPAQSEAVARLVSLGLRNGIDAEEIVEQIDKIRCPTCIYPSKADVRSCPHAMAKALKLMLNSEEKEVEDEGDFLCPECGTPKVGGRCGVCPNCGEGGCA